LPIHPIVWVKVTIAIMNLRLSKAGPFEARMSRSRERRVRGRSSLKTISMVTAERTSTIGSAIKIWLPRL